METASRTISQSATAGRIDSLKYLFSFKKIFILFYFITLTWFYLQYLCCVFFKFYYFSDSAFYLCFQLQYKPTDNTVPRITREANFRPKKCAKREPFTCELCPTYNTTPHFEASASCILARVICGFIRYIGLKTRQDWARLGTWVENSIKISYIGFLIVFLCVCGREPFYKNAYKKWNIYFFVSDKDELCRKLNNHWGNTNERWFDNNDHSN